LLPTFGIGRREAALDLDRIFGRRAGRVLEIGFGNGDNLVKSASENPELDYIGIEVHEPGVGHCLIMAREAGITNLRIIRRDAVEVLQKEIPDRSLTRINLLFPDPWPKKRHRKRRIIQPPFVGLVANKLVAHGSLHIATDWANYAEYIDAVMAGCDRFELVEYREHGGDQPLDRYTTRFETRGLGKGHQICDWRYVRIRDSASSRK